MNTRKNIRITKDDLYHIVWCAEIEKIFQESKSTIILEEDSVSVQIKLLCKRKVWLRYKLRDRSFDGPNWQSSPLTDWSYGGPDDEFILGSALEESIYCLDPRYALKSMFSESQAQFIANPFEELPYDCPDEEALLVWLKRWRGVFALEKPPFPGYFYLKNIPGVRRKIFEKAVRCLNQNGYRYFTAVPTWWHIACMYEHLGLKYQFKEDEQRMNELNKLLRATDITEREKLSWIIMLQFWVELAEKSGFIAENDLSLEKKLVLRDSSGSLVTYPLSPKRNLWQIKKLD